MSIKFWLRFKTDSNITMNKFFPTYKSLSSYINKNNIKEDMIIAIRTKKQER